MHLLWQLHEGSARSHGEPCQSVPGSQPDRTGLDFGITVGFAFGFSWLMAPQTVARGPGVLFLGPRKLGIGPTEPRVVPLRLHFFK